MTTKSKIRRERRAAERDALMGDRTAKAQRDLESVVLRALSGDDFSTRAERRRAAR